MRNQSIAAILTLLILTFSQIGCSQLPQSNSTKVTTSKSQAQWQQWVTKYDKGRRSNTGWLSLAGLFWLQQGDNSLGSLSTNQHILPSGSPEELGVISVKDDNIQISVTSEAVKIDGQPLSNARLNPNETQVTFSSYSFYIIKREKGYAVRLKNKLNPSIKHFKGTHFYHYNPELKVTAKLIPPSHKKTIDIATVYNTVRKNDSAGLLEFIWQGKSYQLEAISYGKDEPMALMFVDETSQDTTYGAGRFLDVEWPKDGDMTSIDFNYAYNPPCAITPFATCPLPPRQNHLDFKVEAGELFSGH